MATIQAVTGPIDTAQLGRVLMHEHIVTKLRSLPA
jgi:predicted metal-dependent phosphotriesterase family hydrolase